MTNIKRFAAVSFSKLLRFILNAKEVYIY